MIDLTKILKPGDRVWNSVRGEYLIVDWVDCDRDFWQICMGKGSVTVTMFGQYSRNPEADCMIFPSKDQRDWQKYVDDKKTEELFTEAIRRYPAGSLVESVYTDLQGIITGNFSICSDGDIFADVKHPETLKIVKITVYKKSTNTWANIITPPYTDSKQSPFTKEQEDWIAMEIINKINSSKKLRAVD